MTKVMKLSLILAGIMVGSASAGLITWGAASPGTLVDEVGTLLVADLSNPANADFVQLYKVVGSDDRGKHALNGDTVDDTLVSTAWIGRATVPPALPHLVKHGEFNGPDVTITLAMDEQFYFRFYNDTETAIGVGDWFGDSDLYTVVTEDALLAVNNVAQLATTVEIIPEPATLGLMGLAGIGIVLARRKARR